MDHRPGTLALIGSGELAESMAPTHRHLMSQLGEPVRAVFVDTPAGFEVNVDEIAIKAADYFQHHYSLSLARAEFKSAKRAEAAQVERAVRQIQRANYIFAGPGSPTYAVRNWRGSRVWEAIARQFELGAQLVLASAAAISLSRQALPVYEIYKAGEDPMWREGLDLLAPYGLDLAIISHWNNTEGGKYDTRFCFMGEARFAELEKLLPDSTTVLGIDEYTACLFDLAENRAEVMGAGQVTIRQRGRAETVPSGSSFSLDELRNRTGPTAFVPAPFPAAARTDHDQGVPMDEETAARELETELERAHAVLADRATGENLATSAGALYELAQAIDQARQAGVQPNLIDQARDAIRELEMELASALSEDAVTGDIAPFVDLILDIRSQLRSARQFEVADRIREGLARLGIALQDASEGTIWSKVEANEGGPARRVKESDIPTSRHR